MTNHMILSCKYFQTFISQIINNFHSQPSLDIETKERGVHSLIKRGYYDHFVQQRVLLTKIFSIISGQHCTLSWHPRAESPSGIIRFETQSKTQIRSKQLFSLYSTIFSAQPIQKMINSNQQVLYSS